MSGPSFQTLYSIVQCRADISEQNCSYCLSQVDTTNEPSSVPATPTGNETRSVAQADRNRGVPKALIFAAVLATVGVLFIIFLVIFLRSRKKKNMRTYNEERNLEDGSHLPPFKGFSDLEDFWDDLLVSRLKYNAVDDFQEVFQTTSRKSPRRLPGSLLPYQVESKLVFVE
ncbi:hypothetical protein DY000_02055072 [Brassica cretica]|uniref:Uncharacterized protein n=1 Tax=Brassica cretica TaxID=69181 RepID=A0ABQ7AHF0_BRACR|nr:hypothetical protein DY000_02055072 [Brassica cretica]